MPLQAAHTAAPLLHCSSPTAAAAVTAAAAAASCHVRCTTFLPLQAALTLLCCHGLRLAVSPQLLLLLPLLLLCRFVCRTIVCTAYLPSPGLEPAPAPLALANHQLSLLRRSCFYQAQPEQCGSILELSADVGPQFRRGSTADRPHTSRLSLSPNSRVTVMSYQDRQLLRSNIGVAYPGAIHTLRFNILS